MMLYKVWLSTSEVVWETNCWAVAKAACFQRHRGFELVSQRCWCCDFTASQSPAFLFSRSDRVQWGGKWQVSSKKTDMSYLRQGPFTIGFFLQLHQILPGVKDGIESYSHVYDIWTYIYIYTLHIHRIPSRFLLLKVFWTSVIRLGEVDSPCTLGTWTELGRWVVDLNAFITSSHFISTFWNRLNGQPDFDQRCFGSVCAVDDMDQDLFKAG